MVEQKSENFDVILVQNDKDLNFALSPKDEEKMSRIRFKRAVLQTMTLLTELGYQPIKSGHESGIVEFWKDLTEGVRCEIEFQLRQFYEAHVRIFTVGLYRIRLPSFPQDDPRFARLAIDLPNLMWFIYKTDSAPSHSGWEFTDESTLGEQLLHAQNLLIEYGIKWLEDPLSTETWVRRE